MSLFSLALYYRLKTAYWKELSHEYTRMDTNEEKVNVVIPAEASDLAHGFGVRRAARQAGNQVKKKKLKKITTKSTK